MRATRHAGRHTTARRAGIAPAVLAVAVLTGCTGGAPAPGQSGSGSSGSGPSGGSSGASAAGGTLTIHTTPAADARDVSPTRPVTVSVDTGTLTSVSLTNPAGRVVGGALSGDRRSWSSGEPLGYARTYRLAAVAQDGAGQAHADLSFTTLTPAGTIFPSFYPPPKIRKIGVGQPLVVIFDKPPPDRAAAERALSVTADPPQTGGWYWWDSRTLHYRPQRYWKAGTRITLRATVYGVDLGGGMYGETDRTLSLTVGQSKVAIVDDRAHRMYVYVDGRRVRTIPVSMGRPGSITVKGKKIDFRTRSGVHVVQEKYPVKQMTSASFGLPRNYSLGYDARIPLAVRISNSGEFVHSAPWSVAQQGHSNVSHGCVNIGPAAARWFYDTFGYGDVVDIRNTGVRLPPTDGFGDWNIPWQAWLAGSAVH